MAEGQRLTCVTCKRKFTRPLGTRRINCFECRPQKAQRPNWAQISQLPGTGAGNGADGPDPAENGPIEGKLARLSRIQLEEWGVAETWQGQAAMALAALIDEGKGGGSGGAASAVKAHREAMQVAHDVAEIVEEDKVTSIFSMQA